MSTLRNNSENKFEELLRDARKDEQMRKYIEKVKIRNFFADGRVEESEAEPSAGESSGDDEELPQPGTKNKGREIKL